MDHRSVVTLVTGSNGGLGKELAEHLITAGYRNIACHYHSSCKEIEEVLLRHDLDPAIHLYQADLTREKDLADMRCAIEAGLGKTGHLLNLAGGSSNGMSWKLSKEDFQKIIEMNLISTFLACREFLPGMREAGYGRIVNTSSVVGFTGVAGASHYSAAKAAIIGFSKSLALELANKGVTVNSLGLGYYDTGIIDQVPSELQTKIKAGIPLQRFGNSSEIAGLVCFLFSKDSSYLTGQTLHLNGGLY